MSATAAAHADVISLDDYRRSRASRTGGSLIESRIQAPLARPVPTVPGPVWVYWVPVWIW